MLPGRMDSSLKGVKFTSHRATAFLFWAPWPGVVRAQHCAPKDGGTSMNADY